MKQIYTNNNHSNFCFGTAGIRGVMGKNRNQINCDTIRRITCSLVEWLKLHSLEEGGVAIAWDTRNNSYDFALETALTIASYGIKSYLYNIPSATPLLSYTVRKLNCSAGVVITASHNPKEYNGYKIYDNFGCQITSSDTNEIEKFMQSTNQLNNIISQKEAESKNLLIYLGEKEMKKFCLETIKQSHFLDINTKSNLNVVYTPLHGTGLNPICFVLNKEGYNISCVQEQSNYDASFSTVTVPNPEEKESLFMAINQAKKNNADVVLATDPDCDRVGLAVRNNDDFVILNGNEIGALLVNYVLTRRKNILSNRSVILKSIVTDDLGANIAMANGINVEETLTGFKYIGQAITNYEKNGYKDFIMGYEESCGFLIGKHVRDKDAVVTSLLICEMAAFYKRNGYTIYDILKSLYSKFGYYINNVSSVGYFDITGKEKIDSIMTSLRKAKNIFADNYKVQDYLYGYKNFPIENVLKYVFDDDSWVAIRPSGTEPKLKIYYSVKDKNKYSALTRLKAYDNIISNLII